MSQVDEPPRPVPIAERWATDDVPLRIVRLPDSLLDKAGADPHPETRDVREPSVFEKARLARHARFACTATESVADRAVDLDPHR
jgi:hypothetical protein